MRHEEAPAISLTGPGATTPAPNAAHWLSAAPITSGTPAGSPSSPAARSGSSAAWTHGGRAAGNSAGSTPKAASSSGSHARWRRLNSSVAFALVSSVAASPDSRCRTTSRGWSTSRVRAKTSGSFCRIHSSFGPTWNASGRCPVRSCMT